MEALRKFLEDTLRQSIKGVSATVSESGSCARHAASDAAHPAAQFGLT